MTDCPFLLDVSRLIWRRWKGRLPTGIDRVCLAYLRHFGQKAQAVVQRDGVYRLLCSKASQELFDILNDPDRSFRARLIFGALAHVIHANASGQGRFYLNVGHTGLNSPGFRRWIHAADVRPIYLVHDLIPITHPHFCRAGEAEKHRERMRTVLATASGVIGNSQTTLDELRAFARSENLPEPPLLVAPLGVDPLPSTTKVSQPERPTFVTIGTIEARKNHLLLLEIWSRLVDRFGFDAPRLLVIGQRGWEADEVFRVLDSSEKLRGHVVELGTCSDEALAGHLASACALLFPSQAEGYGLPLAETLGTGVPVIASDLPAFRELAGNIPTYLDPEDSNAWEAAIIDYASPDSAARNAQLERLKSYRLPDWGSHFAKVERWLHTLGNEPKAQQH